MAEIVNLRQARKRKAREEAEREAAANRAKFGMTKFKRAQITHENAHADHTLDAHKIERGEPDKSA
jgi:Domain of unknown function (DUF4169)